MTESHATYAVLPLRDIVVFPHMIVPLFVGREKSIKALEDVMKDDKQILLATQKNAGDDDPTPDDVYTVGTVGTVLQLLKLPDGTVKVLVEGAHRARIIGYTDKTEFFEANAKPIEEGLGDALNKKRCLGRWSRNLSSTSSSTGKFPRRCWFRSIRSMMRPSWLIP